MRLAGLFLHASRRVDAAVPTDQSLEPLAIGRPEFRAQRTIAGRVCMDQFVVDLEGDEAAAGDPVVLFGPGTDGAPTDQDWADACGTISYEIVTRVGGRMRRSDRGTREREEPAAWRRGRDSFRILPAHGSGVSLQVGVVQARCCRRQPRRTALPSVLAER